MRRRKALVLLWDAKLTVEKVRRRLVGLAKGATVILSRPRRGVEAWYSSTAGKILADLAGFSGETPIDEVAKARGWRMARGPVAPANVDPTYPIKTGGGQGEPGRRPSRPPHGDPDLPCEHGIPIPGAGQAGPCNESSLPSMRPPGSGPPARRARPVRPSKRGRGKQRGSVVLPSKRGDRPPHPEAFEAFPRLEAPLTVEPGQVFVLTIGLATSHQAGVHGGKLEIELDPRIKRFALDLQVVADGFAALDGWRHTLAVDRADPAATSIRVRLRALPEIEQVWLSSLIVHYSYRGVPCGTAWRNIAVVPAGRRLENGPLGKGWLVPEDKPLPISVRESIPAADLTVRISKPDGNPATGAFVWTFESPHAVSLATAPLPMHLGEDAATFARQVIQEVQRNTGTPLIENTLESVGRAISDHVPAELWPVLEAVAARAKRRLPTVLLLSAESEIPWELAYMDEPLDPSRPPYLGAQVAVGRWILSRNGPPLPPPASIAVEHMAVVVGGYDDLSGGLHLPEAEAEGEELEQRHAALRLQATVDDLKRLFDGNLVRRDGSVGGAEAVHFSCHGRADPTRPETSAILLDDGQPLSALLFRGARVGSSHHPFLFLNACQVGTAGRMLDDYAGFAGHSLRAGFSAFLAPLWAVDDAHAKRFALSFYGRTFNGAAVAEALREERARFGASGNGLPEPTYLAYVFYGHPALRLERQGRKEGPEPAGRPLRRH